MELRREPFRLLFPIGIALAWMGVLPWVLFGGGWVRAWPGTYHALTMTQGFLLAIAAAFLCTFIPRRTQTPPASATELGVLAVSTLAIAPAALSGALRIVELAYLAGLLTLAQLVLRRLRSAAAAPSPPPSFVWFPLGILAGVIGALLILAFSFDLGSWTWMAGRSLVEEGVLVPFALALAPVLTPLIAHDLPPASRAGSRPAWQLAAALIYFSGFAIEHALSVRAGLLLRGAVVALVVSTTSGAFRPPSVSGLHRQFFQIALWLVPSGLLAAGARPTLRVPMLHVTYVGGLSLLVFMVSTHVTLMHTGREPLAYRRTYFVGAIAALTLVATVARASAELMPAHYFEALLVASSLWMLGAAIWGVVLLAMLLRPKALAS